MSISAADRDNSPTHDVIHIIVYGLGDSSDCDMQSTFHAFLVNAECASVGSITSARTSEQ